MAHKIGLVLLASLHLMNGQIVGRYSNGAELEGFGHVRPLVSFQVGHKEEKSDDNGGIKLGLNNINLGSGLLKEAHRAEGSSNNAHDGHHGLRHEGNSKGHRSISRKQRSVSKKPAKKPASPAKKPASPAKKPASPAKKQRSVSKKEKKEEKSAPKIKIQRKEAKSEDSNKGRKEKKSEEPKKEEKSEDGHHHQPTKVVVNIIKKVEPKVERKEKKSEETEFQHKPIDVNKTPVTFKSLRYVDNDEHGEAEKAPITIVTVPLVADRDDDHHVVARNENIGHPNYRQIIKKEAPLNKYDELLKVKVEPPIKNVEVETEEIKEEDTVERNEIKRTVRKDTKFEKKQNAHVRKEIAKGEILEHAPFVVGKVVLAESKHEVVTKEEHTNDRKDKHEHEHEHEDSEDGKHKKGYRKHD